MSPAPATEREPEREPPALYLGQHKLSWAMVIAAVAQCGSMLWFLVTVYVERGQTIEHLGERVAALEQRITAMERR